MLKMTIFPFFLILFKIDIFEEQCYIYNIYIYMYIYIYIVRLNLINHLVGFISYQIWLYFSN